MKLRECIERVFTGYLNATNENFTEHPIAKFLRGEFRDTVAKSVDDNDRLIFKGSAGQGVWAKGPWVGIFDPLVTSTAQGGYYPVYLFREDMQGVYLSLNQGMTEARKLYKSDAKTALRARAANYRAMLGSKVSIFPDNLINLAPSAPTNDTAYYEAGNICAKFYSAGRIPTEAQLIDDLKNMRNLYQTLFEGEINNEAIGQNDGDEPTDLDYEEGTKFRLHKRIERNTKLSQKVKKLQGHTCKVCSINFEDIYGTIGIGYIEAHHLKPLASLKGGKVAMDPIKDFAVLCANCHRMVHRSGCVENMGKFKIEHYNG
jgi:5-methylcytosine-specific restriction protein A